MSYSKLEVRYRGDGINTHEAKNTRQDVVKKKTIILPKRVQEYGDRYGYGSIRVSCKLDHIILSGGGSVLFDQDINAASDEYIRSIEGYSWLY